LVVPQGWRGGVRLKYGSVNYDLPSLEGATANYAAAWNWPLSEGRDLNEQDVASGSRVALIGDETARTLFGEESPIGKVILLNNFPVTIVGMLQYRGMAGGGTSLDDRLIIPYTTMIQRFNMDRNYVNALRIKFRDMSRMDEEIADLASLLRDQHRLAPDQPDDFTIVSAKEIQQFLTMLKGGLVLFLGITAAAAMIVGGFVLANLFYLSVQERRTEIGLRKAMGANSQAILRQFLFEAVGLTILGAAGGVLLGAAGGQLFAAVGLIEMSLSWRVFVIALAAALLVGIIFGLKPARQAASLDPIQALRGGH
jgi:putative ABC transport system permease protein